MKKILILTILIVFCTIADAQEKRYTIMFYNVENLFDTINDPNVNDVEFTPEGANKWNGIKYWKKIKNLEKVFYSISAENKSFPTVIGVAEVENRNVLEDIVSAKKLQKANYQIVHYDSPEKRGVDVAFFYRPDQFKYEGSYPIPVVFEDNPEYKTRDILMMWGTIEGEEFTFMVAHWPSRSGGQIISNPRRCTAAQIMHKTVDSIAKIRPETKFVLMGDLNDNPVNESIYKYLNAKGDVENLKKGELFNPFYQMFKRGYGTIAYQDGWSLFDNIIVSQNLIDPQSNGLTLVKLKNKNWAKIFNRPFLLQQKGQYKGYPFRTYVGGNFQDGYSDHLPVFVFIEKGGAK